MDDKNKHNSLPFNIEGKYFIDDRCDGCGQCFPIASDLISFDQSDVFCYIYKQPKTSEDLNAIENAKNLCPQCAIQTKE